MALTKQHKNHFARRIKIVFTGLVLGSVVGVLSTPLNGLFVYAGLVTFLDVLRMLIAKKPSTNFEQYMNRVTLFRLISFCVFSILFISSIYSNIPIHTTVISYCIVSIICFTSSTINFGYPIRMDISDKPKNYRSINGLKRDSINQPGTYSWIINSHLRR